VSDCDDSSPFSWLLNACFVLDADHFLSGERAQCGSTGHTQDSFGYVVRGTRVICNRRGYTRNGVNENPYFDANLIVEGG
jgi:hypothetical protein